MVVPAIRKEEEEMKVYGPEEEQEEEKESDNLEGGEGVKKRDEER